MALAVSTSRTLISNKKSTSYYLSTCSVLPIKFTSNFGTVSSWNGSRHMGFSFSTNSIKPVSEQSSNTIEETPQVSSITQLKKYLYLATEGINRGIFGVKSDKKYKIEDLVKQLEAQNPTPDPTVNIDELGGLWKLIYSTVTILGSKRTKLGLRDFITLDDFFQTIDVSQGKAVNVIKFSARGLSLLKGQLKIEASFKISSNSRVDICYENSTITPIQLMNMFSKNYDILLGIFNPEGWLEITYVDDNMRIGRDDKGNIFILERSQEN